MHLDPIFLLASRLMHNISAEATRTSIGYLKVYLIFLETECISFRPSDITSYYIGRHTNACRVRTNHMQYNLTYLQIIGLKCGRSNTRRAHVLAAPLVARL